MKPSSGVKVTAPLPLTANSPSPGITSRVPRPLSSSATFVAARELISTVLGSRGWEPLPAVSLPSTSTVTGLPGAVRASSSRSVAMTGEKIAVMLALTELSA